MIHAKYSLGGEEGCIFLLLVGVLQVVGCRRTHAKEQAVTYPPGVFCANFVAFTGTGGSRLVHTKAYNSHSHFVEGCGT